MKKRIVAGLLCTAMCAAMLAGCGNSSSTSDAADTTDTQNETEAEVSDTQEADEQTEAEASDTADAADVEQFEATEVQLFAAASLQNVMEELISIYNETQPNVTITGNYDSSGTLLEQIENGYACDIFFSAAQKQMDTLQNDDGLVVDGSRNNVVNNQVCIVTLKDSGTAVTGLDNIGDAASIALADGSVPVGKYTRQALVNNGQLEEVEDVSTITTEDVSNQLGGVEISEQGNVSKVLIAVAEGSCEVGTVYYSDYLGYENSDELEVIQMISYDLTGNVIYPIGQVVNDEADELETAAAADFEAFLLSDTAKAVFDAYGFDTDVE